MASLSVSHVTCNQEVLWCRRDEREVRKGKVAV